MKQRGLRVTVVSRGDRGKLYLRHTDESGKRHHKATDARTRPEAERLAARWEAELSEGIYKPSSDVKWREFVERYDSEHLVSLAKRTRDKALQVLNGFERDGSQRLLSTVDAGSVSRWQSSLRSRLSESSVKSCTAHLKAALRWAFSIGLIQSVPNIKTPKRASSRMKGRPISEGEFSALLESVESVVGPDRAESWRFLIEGLYWSGLRISEAIDLHWTDGGFTVDLSHDRAMFRIEAASEKANRNRILPMAPEFAEMIGTHGEGFVFNPKGVRSARISAEWASKVITKIGKASGVKTGTGYVSAHDLRRSFGFRWSRLVMPALLQEIMRHDSFETTKQFYIGSNAEATSEVMYRVTNQVTKDSQNL